MCMYFILISKAQYGPAIFQVLYSYVWSVTIILDGTALDYCHPCVLIYTLHAMLLIIWLLTILLELPSVDILLTPFPCYDTLVSPGTFNLQQDACAQLSSLFWSSQVVSSNQLCGPDQPKQVITRSCACSVPIQSSAQQACLMQPCLFPYSGNRRSGHTSCMAETPVPWVTVKTFKNR